MNIPFNYIKEDHEPAVLHKWKRSYLPVSEEIQCYLYILKFMESHASFFSRLKEKKIFLK